MKFRTFTTARNALVALLLLLLVPLRALAGVEQLGEAEFRALAHDLAPKVNLFRDAWDRDPAAEFYGGTTRDYLYWIKGHFKNAKTSGDAQKIAAELRAVPVIDVREFIIGESDVDLFSATGGGLRAETYGVRKIDVQKPDALDPTTELGRNEHDQGFIPAEKIRLGKESLRGNLGDGVGEIYRGKLSVHFSDPEVFKTTAYAKEGLNHPILLALRYLRLQAIDYYQTFGAGRPDAAALLARIDPVTTAKLKDVIDGTLDGKTLLPFLEKPQFKKWLNGAIQKAFRSYTNPDAARVLMDGFNVVRLPDVYSGVEPVNQYVFRQFRDPAQISANLARDEVDPAKLYVPVEKEFPDGFLYHGVKKEPAFRSILFQGVLESEGGSAGAGLYGVALPNRQFAEQWSGSKDRLVRFPVASGAKIVDIEKGYGAEVWARFQRQHGADFEKFTEVYGIDVLRYPYKPSAYVVKNSEALGRAQGVNRELLSLGELTKRARTITDPEQLLKLIEINNLRTAETELLLKQSQVSPAALEADFRAGKFREAFLKYVLPTQAWSHREDLALEILAKEPKVTPMRSLGEMQPETSLVLSKVFPSPAWVQKEEMALAATEHVKDLNYLWTTYLFSDAGPPMPKLVRKMLETGYPPTKIAIAVGKTTSGGRPSKWLAYPDLIEEVFRAVMSRPRDIPLALTGDLWTGRWEILDKLEEGKALTSSYLEFLSNPRWRVSNPERYDRLVTMLAHRNEDLTSLIARVLAKPHNAHRLDLVHFLLEKGNVDSDLLIYLYPVLPPPEAHNLLRTVLERPRVDEQTMRVARRLINPSAAEAALVSRAEERFFENAQENSFSRFTDLVEVVADGPNFALAEKAWEKRLVAELRGVPRLDPFLAQKREPFAKELLEKHFAQWGNETVADPLREALLSQVVRMLAPGDPKSFAVLERIAANPVWRGTPLWKQARHTALRVLAQQGVREVNTDPIDAVHTLLHSFPDLGAEPELRTELLRHVRYYADKPTYEYKAALPATILWKEGVRDEAVEKVIKKVKGLRDGHMGERVAQAYVERELAKLAVPGDCTHQFRDLAQP